MHAHVGVILALHGAKPIETETLGAAKVEAG